MVDSANRSYLKLCVAKICQDVGFNAIQTTPLEVLTDLLQDYITALAKSAYNYALHCGNTEPNLNHLALAFKDMGVSIAELKEYVRYVDSSAVFDCPKYPVTKESQLNLLKPGSREVVTRPFHIHEHLPPMHPHLEDQDLPIKQDQNQENNSDSTSPISNVKTKTFKRPGDSTNDGLPNKRSKFVCEEEGRPLRELSSVMMTTSGFLSPAREGKLPEARTPIIKAELPLNQETNSNPLSFNELKVKKKGKLSPDNRKLDKDNKIPFERESDIIKDDEVKQKQSNGGKESSKKLPKITSVKVNTPTSSSLNTNTPKVLKQGSKIKNPTISSLNSTPKGIKVKSPKNDKNIQIVFQKDVSLSPVSLTTVPSEYKIASEPDKQKINILKKISKLKEDTVEDADDKPLETGCLSRVDITIEYVIKREMVCAETAIPEIDFKEEVVDIETVHSPNPYDTLIMNNNDSNLENLSHGSTVALLPKPDKKKKKIKKINKKEQNLILDVVDSKSLKISREPSPIHEPHEEVANVGLSVQNPSVSSTHEKIPSPIVQQSVLSDVTPKKEAIAAAATIDRLPNDANKNKNIVITTEQSGLNLVPLPLKTEDQGFDLSNKKKIHKKEKKEKLKKKKKDKIKNKEKSEKRKLKLERKVKDKEKQRIKKEKKERRKEKEIEESKNDITNAVPKITLKLGPASPTSNNDNSRKIVIIPIVRKDELSKPDRAPSPELARFSPLVPNPKQKPSKNISVEDTKLNTENKVSSETMDPTPLPPCVKLDSEGNKMWFCPACGRQDDGSPMIGCDECDAWYHWVCVGIQVPPEVINWYCNTCIAKKKVTESEKKKKNKKKNIGKKVKDT